MSAQKNKPLAAILKDIQSDMAIERAKMELVTAWKNASSQLDYRLPPVQFNDALRSEEHAFRAMRSSLFRAERRAA